MQNFVVVNNGDPHKEFITQYEKEVSENETRTFAGPLVYAEDWDAAEDFCAEFMPTVVVIGESDHNEYEK